MKIPLRARASLLRQRTILRIRFWFRLEIDDIKERIFVDEIEGLKDLNKKQLDTITTLTRVVQHLNARLALYEKEIPRMRELKRKFDLEQAGFRQPASQAKEALSDGILPINGKVAHP